MPRLASRLLIAALTAASAAATALAVPASAHDVAPTAFSQVRQDGSDVRYDLSIRYGDLAATIEPAASATASPLTDARRADRLRRRWDAVEARVSQHVTVQAGGVPCHPTLTAAGVESFEGTPFATLTVIYRCPQGATTFRITYDLFPEGDAQAQANLVDYTLAGEQGRIVLHPGATSLIVGDRATLAAFGRYVGLGVEHILGGLDHVLFLLALVLGARSTREVLRVASAFTIAHSVTLAFAGLGWVDLPAVVVEPLIALSIAYVAIENLLRGPSRHRPLVVFAFGLLHGFGFAGSVTFPGESGLQLLPTLLAFNLGIEAGQLGLILITMPILLLIRRLPWSRIAQLGTTATIAGFGLFWFAQRIITA